MLVLMGAGGVALGLAWVFASRSLPEYEGTLRLSGIAAPVEIVRDTAAVPHIFGASDADVFFALGLAHAQDRLWQMTLMRRTVQGRLSEIFGPTTLETDDLMRRLDLYGAARDSVGVQDAQTRAALEAYAAGVNAWLETVNNRALGRGAPEFFLFAPRIAPWQPADSIAILKLMALQLTDQAAREVRRTRAALILPPERLADLIPDLPRGPGPDFGWLRNAVPHLAQAAAPPPWPLAPIGLAGASNAWAAAPERAAAGGTLMASDPHLALSAPSIWYLARLELASGGVIGGTIPGMPLVVTGRSDALGWGLTTTYADDQDLLMEELDPADPTRYRTPDGWKPFETRRTIIEIADAPPVTLTLRWSDNGPILPGRHLGLAAITPEGHVPALAWTALERADTTMSAGLALMQARSIAEGIEAGRRFVAPVQNVVLADRRGVALQVMGVLPARDPESPGQGRLPGLGWMEENRWMGRLDYALNPRILNPEDGIVANTNNAVTDRAFPLHLSFEWGDTQRIVRLHQLLDDRTVHSRESFVAAQLDTVSPTARSLLPLIARDLWFTGEAPRPGTPEAQRAEALRLLAAWNGEMNEHLPEPLIYAAWMRRLQSKLIEDDLGPLTEAFARPEPLFLERVFRDIGGASAWCDIRQSSLRESCTDIARIALDEALIELAQTQGGRISALRWGDAHEARHDHPVLGDVPVLKWLVDIRQSTSGGDNTLMRGLTANTGPAPYANVHGAGFRGVYDFADPDSSLFISATGQSGHPLSRHYDDLGELWRRGEYIPMSLNADLARAGAIGTLWLRPVAGAAQSSAP